MMKMDRKRTLIVKHPHLRKVRDALRMAIVDAVFKKKKEIRDKERKYKAGHPKRKSLISQSQELDHALKASVCMCPICRSQTSDMVFNPILEKWYCIKCYEENRKWYRTHPNSTESRYAPNPFP